MSLSRNKLYILLTIACLAGYSWLYFNITSSPSNNNGFGVCLIKHVTNIPCPSCGSTRSVISLTQGNFIDALYINPFGLIIGFILLLTPVWLLKDVWQNKKTLFISYIKFEHYLKKPQVYIPLISLVILNWVWNITKGL